MGFIKLNRYEDNNSPSFDPAEVVNKARAAFADVRVLADDQLALNADRAANANAPEHIVRTLRRNQLDYGPAYAFEFATEGGSRIQGRARRCDVTFLFNDPLTPEWRQRLVAFLGAFGPGRLEQIEQNLATPA